MLHSSVPIESKRKVLLVVYLWWQLLKVLNDNLIRNGWISGFLTNNNNERRWNANYDGKSNKSRRKIVIEEKSLTFSQDIYFL